MDIIKIAIEGSLDVLVEIIESLGPTDGLLEMVELILADQLLHSLLKLVVQSEGADHSPLSGNKLFQLKSGLHPLDLVSDKVNSSATGVTENKGISLLSAEMSIYAILCSISSKELDKLTLIEWL